MCGKTERITWGMVSPFKSVRCRMGHDFDEAELPMIIPNAHIPTNTNEPGTDWLKRRNLPPNAKANWKNDTAARPLEP